MSKQTKIKPEEEKKSSEQETSSEKKKKKILIILCGFCMLSAIVVLSFLKLQKKKDKNKQVI